MAGNLGSKRRLSVHEQFTYMRQIWPNFECKVRGGRLSCCGTVQPFLFNETYRVRISYCAGRFPQVFVDKPVLKRRKPAEPIPHTYEGDRPCLFFPPDRSEWSSDKIIAQTIVPWLMTWLFYYEAWLATGTWQGGGIHPNVGDEKAEEVEQPEPQRKQFLR